jgi:signal transduction histidine kinase
MKFFQRLMGMFLVALVCCGAQAAEHGSIEQAKALLAKSVAYVKANGKEKALAAFMDKKGDFVQGDLYITVIDMKGKTLAHPFVPRLIGMSNLDLEDADGKKFYRERIEIATAKGHGEQDYNVLNPKTKDIEHKVAYFEKVGDIILTSGTFKP